MRVSKSRSKVLRDGRCVIVYRMDEGHYSDPITLSRSEAVQIAKRFRQNASCQPDRNINLAAASYVYDAANKMGWLENESVSQSGFKSNLIDEGSSDGDEHDTVVTRESEDTEQTSPQLASELPTRKYFPFIAASIRSSINEDVYGDLAFVLSGVHPAKRVDPQTNRTHVTLSEILEQSSDRISPTQELMRDHHYALSQYHHLDLNHFRSRWSAANDQLGKQDATDLLKLVRKLRKLQLGDEGAAFKDVNLQPVLESIYDHSLELMHYQFRWARRKLEETHATPVRRPAPSTFSTLLQRLQIGKAKSKTPEPVRLSDVEREIAHDYLDVAIKLGQIARAFP
ncbi:hypothetical protein LOC67_26220 [Stieleria sp. JC731]|uniref:hypothetical protein n=1 Tax=Pirellulaceae TaxID=2691357 RepID=UPI001E61B39D|nr:hypothetical protein [Stieleria sp. JC731]MCC9604065.1 hypothetical protein [Stieleria sp. JC731]